MVKQVKKVFVVTLCCMMVFGTNSCNKSGGDSANTIKFWHFWSEPSQRAALQQMIGEFEKQNNCKVEVTELSWNDGKTKLLAAFNSKTAPDAMEFGSDWVAQFSSSGVLKEIPAADAHLENYIDWSHQPCMWKGKIYALPWVVDTRVLYVNKGLLEQAGITTVPTTMNDVLTMSEKVQSLSGNNGFGANGADPHKVYKKILPLMWSNGGDVFNENGECIINSKENIDALELYVQLSRSGLIDTQKQLDAAFTQGKLAFWNSGGWLADKIGRENPLLDYTVIPLPPITGEHGTSFAGGEYLSVNAASEKQELATKLIQYITNGKTALTFCKQITEAGFPADKIAFRDTYFASHPIRSVFATQLQHAKMTPVHAKWLSVEEIIENAVVEVLYGRKTSEEALNEAAYQISKLKTSK